MTVYDAVMRPWRRRFCLLLLVLIAVSAAGETIDSEDDAHANLWARFRAWRLERIAETDAYLLVAPTAVYVNLQDTRMSPLVYSGFGAGVVMQDAIERPRWLNTTTFSAHVAVPEVPAVLPGTYQAIGLAADAAFLYRLPGVGKKAEGELAAGGSLSATGNIRVYDKLQNSALNADIVASVNASLSWQMQFTLFGQPVTWSLRAKTPLFSYVGRAPEYTLHGLSSSWAPPWSFARATVETGLGMPLRHSNENRIRLWYGWDFYAFSEFDGLHVLRIATHQIGLSLATRRM